MIPRRTKIVATLGPASSSPEVLEKMIVAGLDVARLNFSHGSPDAHRARAELVREIAARHDVQPIDSDRADEYVILRLKCSGSF